MLKIPANVAALAKLAAADNPRYAVAGVLVSERPDGYQVEATDGKRLGVVRGPSEVHEAEAALLAAAPNGATEAIIPARDFAELVKAGFKGRLATVLKLGLEQTTFVAGGREVKVANLDGRWPAVDQVFPKKPPAAEFAVNAKYMADLLQVAAAFGDEGNGNVLVRFWDADHPIALQTAGSGGQSFFGMLMPVGGSCGVPPVEPELPEWVEALAEQAEDLLSCMRKPNGERLKQVRIADCAETMDRLEAALKVAKAALLQPGQEAAEAEEADEEPGDAEADEEGEPEGNGQPH